MLMFDIFMDTIYEPKYLAVLRLRSRLALFLLAFLTRISGCFLISGKRGVVGCWDWNGFIQLIGNSWPKGRSPPT